MRSPLGYLCSELSKTSDFFQCVLFFTFLQSFTHVAYGAVTRGLALSLVFSAEYSYFLVQIIALNKRSAVGRMRDLIILCTFPIS